MSLLFSASISVYFHFCTGILTKNPMTNVLKGYRADGGSSASVTLMEIGFSGEVSTDR